MLLFLFVLAQELSLQPLLSHKFHALPSLLQTSNMHVQTEQIELPTWTIQVNLGLPSTKMIEIYD